MIGLVAASLDTTRGRLTEPMTTDRRTRHPVGGRWHGPMRDSRVVLLTITAGAVNAVSFIVLGKVFSSVITGNMVLLGVAATTGNSGAAIHGGVALAGFSAGVLAGAPIAARGRGDSGGAGGGAGAEASWPGGVTAALAAEVVVLAAFCAGWEAAQGHPHGGAQLTLLVLLAVAMGMQSSAVRRLGQMSSTFLTSTLAGVLAGVATRKAPEGLLRSLGALVAIVAGAVAGGFLATTSAYPWLPLVILLPPCLVIATAVRLERSAGS
jgi:uncharacterized membrane protein YoaK (UPF0700 family)